MCVLMTVCTAVLKMLLNILRMIKNYFYINFLKIGKQSGEINLPFYTVRKVILSVIILALLLLYKNEHWNKKKVV